ncbi:MAG: hypothetical protein JO246_18515 [Frankiaceae bacterium]|nr:hypothetical protein [Frankiaceae bacterium]MBV9872177.1 hypothetical protein [Frankiaceae bacterium]
MIFDAISDFIHELIGGTGSSHLADLGADPHQLLDVSGAHDVADTTSQFPTMGGSAVMDQVNQAMDTATQNYTSGMALADHAPHLESAGQQAQDFIHGVMHASPEQLERTGNQLGGMNFSDHVHNSVNAASQQILDRDAAHEQIRGADKALIDGQSIVNAVRRLLG